MCSLLVAHLLCLQAHPAAGACPPWHPSGEEPGQAAQHSQPACAQQPVNNLRSTTKCTSHRAGQPAQEAKQSRHLDRTVQHCQHQHSGRQSLVSVRRCQSGQEQSTANKAVIVLNAVFLPTQDRSHLAGCDNRAEEEGVLQRAHAQ